MCLRAERWGQSAWHKLSRGALQDGRLHVDVDHLRYANRWLLDGVPRVGSALFVRFIHGHSALGYISPDAFEAQVVA